MHLPIGFELGSDYVIEEVLGQGGFGVAYRALDRSLGVHVAIKEFFPARFAIRNADMSISPRSAADRDVFEYEKRRYFGEAKSLARFKHDAIVGVFRVFEAHGTVYSVLQYVVGDDMERWLAKSDSRPSQAVLDRICASMTSALDLIHSEKVLHRDIKPGNIIIRPDGKPMLLDFGASLGRGATPDFDREVSAIIISDAYSPVESYASDHSRQGPWTDIYSFAAVLHRAVTGENLAAAPSRVLDDTYRPLIERVGSGLYRPSFLKAIDWGLARMPKDRPQSIGEWREMLLPKVPGAEREAVGVGTKVFISYRRAGTSDIAGRIFDRMEREFGANEVFFDVSVIPMGVDFRTHIKNSILQSAVVIAVIGRHWLRRKQGMWGWLRQRDATDHVHTELELAFEFGVPVLPLLVDGAVVPREADLPPAIRGLAGLNAARVGTGADFRPDIDSVVRVVRSLKLRNEGREAAQPGGG